MPPNSAYVNYCELRRVGHPDVLCKSCWEGIDFISFKNNKKLCHLCSGGITNAS